MLLSDSRQWIFWCHRRLAETGSELSPVPGQHQLHRPRTESWFSCFRQTLFGARLDKMDEAPRGSSPAEESPSQTAGLASCSNHLAGALPTSLQTFCDGRSNRTTFISEGGEPWSLCSLSSLGLYTSRQLLLFYSGICNRRESTR